MTNKLKAGIAAFMTLVSATITTPARADASADWRKLVEKDAKEFGWCLYEVLPKQGYVVMDNSETVNWPRVRPSVYVIGKPTTESTSIPGARAVVRFSMAPMTFVKSSGKPIGDAIQSDEDLDTGEFSLYRQTFLLGSESKRNPDDTVMNAVRKCLGLLPTRPPAP